MKFGVGTDNIDLKTAEACGIKVGRCVGSNSNAVAELTIGMMFAAAKHLVSSNVQVRGGAWNKPTGRELTKKKHRHYRLWKYRASCRTHGTWNRHGSACL